jgi:hypothetical protein
MLITFGFGARHEIACALFFAAVATATFMGVLGVESQH